MEAVRCPICGGTGRVPAGFYGDGGYTANCMEVDCRACYGRGIIITPDK